MKKQYQMQYSHKSTLYYEIKTNSYENQYQMEISNDIPGQISQFKTKGKWHHRCKQTRSSLSIHVQSSLWPSMENSANHVYHSLFRMGAFFWCCQYCHHTDLHRWLTYTVLYVAHLGVCEAMDMNGSVAAHNRSSHSHHLYHFWSSVATRSHIKNLICSHKGVVIFGPVDARGGEARAMPTHITRNSTFSFISVFKSSLMNEVLMEWWMDEIAIESVA